MKKLAFTLGIAGLVTVLNPAASHAQTAANNNKTTLTSYEDINTKADKQTAEATKELGLNDEQKSKFKKFAMDRLYKIQPINEKIRAAKDEKEKENLKAQKKQINDEFIKNVNGFLTPQQQEIFKKKLEELKHSQNKPSYIE